MSGSKRQHAEMGSAPREPSTAALLAWLGSWIVGVVIVVGAVFLFLVAATTTARLLSAAFVSGAVAMVLVTSGWVDRKRGRVGHGWLIAGLGVVLALASGGTNPALRAAPETRVRMTPAGSTGLFRYLAERALPEVDQLMVCFTVMTAADRLFTADQAAGLKTWTREIYREMNLDPDFVSLRSALPEVYGEILVRPPKPGPVFVYVPRNLDRRRPAPVIVFFHGSGGCFKSYVWLLSKVADRTGMVLVAPVFGSGNWRLPETEEAYDLALREAARFASVDLHAVHVLGLSNGGLAVSQLGTVRGTQLRSLVFLSPVFGEGGTGPSSVGRQCRSTPLLVLTGDDDDRVPLPYVTEAVSMMRSAGARPILRTYGGANHFLFFSHRDKVVDELAAWFSVNGAGE